jgi:hypothetical protein
MKSRRKSEQEPNNDENKHRRLPDLPTTPIPQANAAGTTN